MPDLQHRADPRRPGRHRLEPRPDRRFDQPTVLLPTPAGSGGGVAVLLDQARAELGLDRPLPEARPPLDDRLRGEDRPPASDGLLADEPALIDAWSLPVDRPSMSEWPLPGDSPLVEDPVPARARHRAADPTGPATSLTGTTPAGSRHRHTEPMPVNPEATAPGRHQTGTADAPRHRSATSPRRPVGRSLIGALAVIGVVSGVEITAASLTGAAGPDTASGPFTDPATLSGVHTLAPQFTPTRPGTDDDRRPASAVVPEPRQATDDRNERDADRNADRDTDRGERRGDVRASGPGLPDPPGLAVPGLNLPGVQPKPKPKAVSTANCGKPGRILDLANWKLTLPTGSSGDPTEIVGSALSGLTNKHFGTGSRCDAVVFRAPVNGTTTKGSKNPRSELREMTGNGSDKAGWSSSSGTHTMKVTEAFTRLPSGKPHLVGAQIHDSSDDVTVFRLEGSKLWVTNGDDPNFKLADADYKLGTPFEAKFVVSGGQVRAFYNGKLVATIAKSFSNGYFKAGAYTQANCGNAPCSSDNYGETLIYDLDVTHS